MVQEVVTREAELELPVLGVAPGEVFEQREVAVPETRAGQGRENIVALLARCNVRGEAGTVDVLVGLEPTSGIAGQRGHKRKIRGTDRVGGARLDGIGHRVA